MERGNGGGNEGLAQESDMRSRRTIPMVRRQWLINGYL